MAPTSKRKVTGTMDRASLVQSAARLRMGYFDSVDSSNSVMDGPKRSGLVEWRLSAMPSCVSPASPRPEGREYLILREDDRSLALEMEAVVETAVYESSHPG